MTNRKNLFGLFVLMLTVILSLFAVAPVFPVDHPPVTYGEDDFTDFGEDDDEEDEDEDDYDWEDDDDDEPSDVDDDIKGRDQFEDDDDGEFATQDEYAFLVVN